MSNRTVGNFLKKGDEVLYLNIHTKRVFSVKILRVHTDDTTLYYTILLGEREINTTGDRIFVNASFALD